MIFIFWGESKNLKKSFSYKLYIPNTSYRFTKNPGKNKDMAGKNLHDFESSTTLIALVSDLVLLIYN